MWPTEHRYEKLEVVLLASVHGENFYYVFLRVITRVAIHQNPNEVECLNSNRTCKQSPGIHAGSQVPSHVRFELARLEATPAVLHRCAW